MKVTVEQIIAKYLQGDLNLDEQHELSKWLQEDQRNPKLLKQISSYWHNHKDGLDVQEIEVRIRIQDMIQKESLGSIQIRKPEPWWVRYSVAASFLIICALIFALYQANSSAEEYELRSATKVIEKVSLPGQKITTRLTDGTLVNMNAGSKILVPEFFEEDRRVVSLVGEAFFNVSRDESKPFIIKTGDIEVTVLGTSFNVLAYDDGSKKAVQVKSGKVSVKNRFGEEIIIEKNEMIVCDLDGELKKYLIDDMDLAFGWIDKRMVFKDHNFTEVLKALERWYGLEVKFERDIISGIKYTAKYENPSLTEVMQSLSHVYQFNYEINGKNLSIK